MISKLMARNIWPPGSLSRQILFDSLWKRHSQKLGQDSKDSELFSQGHFWTEEI